MCGYFCTGSNDFIFKCKSLTDFTNLFSPNNFKEHNVVTLKLDFELKLIQILSIVETSGTHRKVNIYPQVDNAIQFILDKINEIKIPFYSSNSRKRQ